MADVLWNAYKSIGCPLNENNFIYNRNTDVMMERDTADVRVSVEVPTYLLFLKRPGKAGQIMFKFASF